MRNLSSSFVKLRKFLDISVRLTITVLALYWVLSKADISKVITLLSSMNPFPAFLAVFSVFLGLSLSGLRWYIFLQPKIITPLGAIFVTLGAIFYGMFLPAGAGVDLIRGLYVGVKSGSKSQSFASVFIDRMVGFLALLSLALAALILGSKTMRHIGIFILLGFVLSLFSSVIILSRRLRKLGIRVLGKIKVFHLGEKLSRFLLAFDHYRENPKTLIVGFFLSLMIQLFLGLSAYLLALALNLLKFSLDMKFFKTVVYTSLVNLITMLPISLGGLGVREGGFVYLMGPYVGVEGAISISLLYYFANILASLPGLFFIWKRRV